jgi:hypothetical protein
MANWNVWFDEEGEAHYEDVTSVASVPVQKATPTIQEVVKNTTVKKGRGRPKGSKNKNATKAELSERALYGRLKKLLKDMPEFVKTRDLRDAYKALYSSDFALKKSIRDRLLAKAGTRYENLEFGK